MTRTIAFFLLALLAGALPAQTKRITSADDIKALPENTSSVSLWEGNNEAMAALERLQKLERLSVYGRGTTITDEALAVLPKLPALKFVNLSNCEGLTEAAFDTLAKITGLTDLSVIGLVKLSDDGPRRLSKHASLKTLDLTSCLALEGTFLADFSTEGPLKTFAASLCAKFGVKGYKALSSLKNLEELFLSGTSVSVEGVAALAGLKKLRRLNIGGQVTDDAVCGEIAKIESLEELRLGQVNLTDKGGAKLAALKNLRLLWANMTLMGDETLAAFAGHKALKTLSAAHAKFTLKGLAHLKTMTVLDEIYLDNVNVGDEGCKILAECKSITRLNLDEAGVTDAGLDQLAKMTQLVRLDLSENNISAEGALKLTTLTALKHLNLTRIKAITEEVAAKLKEKLTEAKISYDKPRKTR